MGVYSRYKKDPGGFRKLVELLETTAPSKRQKMVDVGMEEDPEYTQKALGLMLTLEDLVGLPDPEFMELLSKVPPRTMAMALTGFPQEDRDRAIRLASRGVRAELDGYSEMKPSSADLSGAIMKVIAVARELERAGKLSAKNIPNSD